MSELTSLKNIGKELERKLIAVGVESAEALKALGAKHAFMRLKMSFPEVCTVHLYALEGAVQGIEFDALSSDKKHELESFSKSLEYKNSFA